MTYLSQGIDYLGFLSAKLRDLRGFTILANELIQNADDAPGAKSISFDICQDALVVENDGVFTDCGKVGDRDCSWKEIKGHRCDFHRFRRVASGDKRDEVGTTGAFGIGFIAVYQITDRPELTSSKRHWIIRPEETEDRRIEENLVMNELGTRFKLPWASTATTTVRRELRAEPINLASLDKYAEQLNQSLPDAMLFLRKIERIEMKRNGSLLKVIECKRKGNQIIITDKASSRTWHKFESSFDEDAKNLREKVGVHQIEQKRSARVTIAIPETCIGVEGLLYATLPTQHRIGLPFNVNADFFPSSDRKRILFDDDYQSRWNKAALSAAADALTGALHKLPGLLNHRDLWDLISRMYSVADQARKRQREPVLEEFWKLAHHHIGDARVIFTSKKHWQLPKDVYLLAAKEEEQECLQVLETLGLEIVHADLRTHHNLLLKLGVRQLGPAELANALRGAGLDKSSSIGDAPGWLRSEKSRSLLAREIGILLKRQPSGALETAKKELASCAIALTNDGFFCPPRNLWRASSETLGVFDPLKFARTFASPDNADIINELVPAFNVQSAINLLSKVPSENFQAIWQEYPQKLIAIIEWFAEQRTTLRNNPGLKDRLRRLTIWPSGGTIHPLDDLAVPGSFEDPLNLASIVDLNALKGLRDFLIDIGAEPLTVTTYALQHVPKAFSSGRTVDADICRRLTIVLATHLGEFRDELNVAQALSKCQIIECKDGSLRLAKETYFANPEVIEVLGSNMATAVLPNEHRQAIAALLQWLGVSSVPRSSDVIQRVKLLIAQPPADQVRVDIQHIFLHLARRWRDHKVVESQFDALKTVAWLPARKDMKTWHSPTDRHLYAPYRSYLFESQASFLDIITKESVSGFLKFLGIEEEPTTRLVVNHLLKMESDGKEVNKEVYRFLNDKADQPEIEHLRNKKCLLLKDSISNHYVRADQVFWSKHPFGSYRFILNPDLRAYNKLFERLGVRESPEPEDSILVLQEISEKFGAENKPLDSEANSVVIQCWMHLTLALEERIIEQSQLRGLAENKVIPDARGILTQPDRVFFEDRHGLAAKFAAVIKDNAISRPQGASLAMEAVGVRPLSKAVQAELVECDNPITDRELIERIHQRQKLIDRVIEAQRASGAVGWNIGLIDSLDVKKASHLQARYTLKIFNQIHKSIPEAVSVYYDPYMNVIYYQEKDGFIPWSAFARELAYALNPEAEPGQVAPGIKEVLSEGSTAEAEEVLNDLGYAPLEVIDASDAVSEEQVDLGGTEEADEPDYNASPSDAGKNSESKEEKKVEQQPRILSPDEALKILMGGNVPGHTPIPLELGKGETTGSGNPSEGTSTGGRKEKPSSRRQRGRLRTYTVPEGAKTNSGSGSAQSEANDSVDRAGIICVIEYETQAGRYPEEMPHNFPGYDIESSNEAGMIERYIEVKSTNGDWGTLGVGLTRTQFEAAQESKDKYWLYIVERAEQDDARIIRIQNPACQVDQFLYDDGWRDLSEEIVAKAKNETLAEA